jgi:predicted nucleotidyltransferase
MSNDELLRQIKARLKAVHGDRLKGIVLYGSQARGDYRPDSDIDVLVLLEGPIDLVRDLEKNIDALYSLSEELDRRISAKPVSAEEYRTFDCPLYRNAQAEGILA